MVKANLDVRLSISFQDPSAVAAICDKVFFFIPRHGTILNDYFQVSRKFPMLGDYENDWPTRDFVQSFLKYSSSQERRRMSTSSESSDSSVGQFRSSL